MENGRSDMAQTKQNRRKRSRIAVPVVGAVGASMAVVGGAYAKGVVGLDAVPDSNVPGPQINLTEEEIADVNLGTFFVFDRENLQQYGEQYAQRGCGRGCRGCAAARCGGAGRCAGCAAARCRGCTGCRGCAVGGVRACIACGGCAGCSCGCCVSWGACRWLC
jgi:hypothetical protein